MTEITSQSNPPQEWGFWQRLTRRKLRNYLFLDKRLQFNIALLLVVIGSVNAFYFSILFYFYSQESLFRVATWIPEYMLEDILRNQLSLWRRTMVFVVSFELILVMLLGLFFSHRIAGPIYAISLRLKDLISGIIPNAIRLRKNDLLLDFAELLNQAFAMLREQNAEIEAAKEDLRAGRVDAARERLEKARTLKPFSGVTGDSTIDSK